MNNKYHIVISFLVVLFIAGCNTNNKVDKSNCFIDLNIPSIVSEYQQKGKPLEKLKFNSPINSQSTQRDLQILKLILEESSPALYRYHSKQQIDSLFNVKICELKESSHYLDFIRNTAQILSYISCGHSGWSHNPNYHDYRKDSMLFFPLKIKSIGTKYFVNQNGSLDNQISVGDELLKINGLTPDQINEVLKSHMAKDGASGYSGRIGISRYFTMAYSNFIANPDTFELICRSNNSNKEYTVHLASLKKGQIDSNIEQKYGNNQTSEKPLKLSFKANTSTAIYSIQSFRNEHINSFKQNFMAFTDSVFQILGEKEIQNLIIDLRGNTGGWTANGKHLFSYFIADSLNYIEKVEFKKVDSSQFSPFIINTNGISDSMNFKMNDEGFYEWTNYPNLKVKPIEKNAFNKQVYILIDDFSMSCSATFSSLMHAHTNAIFIGKETGGAQCGSNAMVMTIQLPYTGVLINLSTAKYTCNVDDTKNSRGVVPDFFVDDNLGDFLKKQDTQMDFTLKLINNVKHKKR